MIRVALRITYQGSAFDSYARTPGRRTVEGALLDALRKEGLVEGSFRTGSRTDAGVSAFENVLLAELERPHLRGLAPALQANLPEGAWVTAAALAPEGFDPRRASWRQYRYLAPQSGESLAAMQAAAKHFLGTHHMAAFARLEAGRDPHRTVLACDVANTDGLWRLTVRGQSFLWGQVRRMASAILAIGAGHAEPDEIARALSTGTAHARFGVAPSEGLVLERVHYEALAWDPEAGGVELRRAQWGRVEAEVRRDVARHIEGLGIKQTAPAEQE